MQSRYGISISRFVPHQRDCKGDIQFIDMSREITIHSHGNNDAKEYNECCHETDVNACDMSRTKSELEFAFNDEVDPPPTLNFQRVLGRRLPL